MTVFGALSRHANPRWTGRLHYNDVIMSTIASQVTSLANVYSIVYSGADQSKHQNSASLAFVWGIHRGPVNSPHKGPVTRKMFPFDDVIMSEHRCCKPFFLETLILLRWTMYCIDFFATNISASRQVQIHRWIDWNWDVFRNIVPLHLMRYLQFIDFFIDLLHSIQVNWIKGASYEKRCICY